jgi:hypothetical protein
MRLSDEETAEETVVAADARMAPLRTSKLPRFGTRRNADGRITLTGGLTAGARKSFSLERMLATGIGRSSQRYSRQKGGWAFLPQRSQAL